MASKKRGQIRTPASDMAEDNKRCEFAYADGAVEMQVMISSGGAERFRQVTDLTITIDGTTWTDIEDDDWSFALGAYQSCCDRLEHITIIIQGSTLFTRLNYIKPLFHTTTEVFSNIIDAEDPDCDNHSPTFRAGRKNVNQPSPRSVVTKYTNRSVPITNVAIHIAGEKAIITALKAFSPIPRISIIGPMELSLRRELISSLNPNWQASPHCVAQYGLKPADAAKVAKTETLEAATIHTGYKMCPIGPNLTQDGEDFGATKFTTKTRNAENLYGMPASFVVPTGKAGRVVLGWKAGKTWRGP